MQLTAQQLAAIREACDVHCFDWATAINGHAPCETETETIAEHNIQTTIAAIAGVSAKRIELVEYSCIGATWFEWFGSYIVRIEFSNGQTLLVGDTEEPIDNLH